LKGENLIVCVMFPTGLQDSRPPGGRAKPILLLVRRSHRHTCAVVRGGASLVALVMVVACNAGQPPLESFAHGGSGPPTLVLLHGYGSAAEEWMPFTKVIAWPAEGRFVFPQGPEFRPGGGRAWWPLDLYSNIAADGVPDLSATTPPGLPAAADRVIDLLKGIRAAAGPPVVLGGFSQGAMVTSEVAFRTDTPLNALVLLSPTIVNESIWKAGYSRRRGLPVFIAHGRNDRVLSFAIADRFRQELEGAGLEVTWLPFDGEHMIPGKVVAALNTFLARVLAGQER
jgi:phospholipase/carboxylesterase